MVFADDTRLALVAAVALVNSESGDDIRTPADLDAFFVQHEYTGRHDGDRAEVEAVLGVRGRLRELLTAERDGAVTLLNEMLREYDALPQLVRHDHLDWHIHAVGPDRPLHERIVVETAMAMIDVVRADEMSRLGVCADEDCEDVVLDLSRNRSRRFCSSACGNRNAVAAYRARQSAGA